MTTPAIPPVSQILSAGNPRRQPKNSKTTPRIKPETTADSNLLLTLTMRHPFEYLMFFIIDYKVYTKYHYYLRHPFRCHKSYNCIIYRLLQNDNFESVKVRN